VRTTETERCQDESSEEPRHQPSDDAEYLSSDASPEELEALRRRSRWQGCRRFRRSWNTGSSFFGSSMRFPFENCCPHDDPDKLLRSTASVPPADRDEALLAKGMKNRPRSRAESLRSDVTELPLRSDVAERLPQGTKRKVFLLTTTPDKLPPLVSDVKEEIGLPSAKAEKPQSAVQRTLAPRVARAHILLQMLKKTNETQVAKAVMDLAYDDERCGETEKVFCEMIDKKHLQIQKFSGKGKGVCKHVCAGMCLCARTCMRSHVRSHANCRR
jgi:hypothetical protein